MELENNQSALILESSAEGEITVNVASADIDSLTGRICYVIAKKLMEDLEFQENIMTMVDEVDGVG